MQYLETMSRNCGPKEHHLCRCVQRTPCSWTLRSVQVEVSHSKMSKHTWFGFCSTEQSMCGNLQLGRTTGKFAAHGFLCHWHTHWFAGCRVGLIHCQGTQNPFHRAFRVSAKTSANPQPKVTGKNKGDRHSRQELWKLWNCMCSDSRGIGVQISKDSNSNSHSMQLQCQLSLLEQASCAFQYFQINISPWIQIQKL